MYLNRHGSSAAGLMHAVDWMPTLLRLAGADNHTNNPMDGVDMWDMLCNGAPSKRTSIVHNINQKVKFQNSSIVQMIGFQLIK